MKIYLKYQEILENGEMLLKLTDEYNEIIENIIQSSNNINQEWISDNKDYEIQQLNTLIKNLKINKNYYELFAKIIKSVNENFLLTEEEASQYMIMEKINEVS